MSSPNSNKRKSKKQNQGDGGKATPPQSKEGKADKENPQPLATDPNDRHDAGIIYTLDQALERLGIKSEEDLSNPFSNRSFLLSYVINFTVEEVRPEPFLIELGNKMLSLTLTGGYTVPTEKVYGIMRPLMKGVEKQKEQYKTIAFFELTCINIQFNAPVVLSLKQASFYLKIIIFRGVIIDESYFSAFLTYCTSLQVLKILENMTMTGNFLKFVKVQKLRELCLHVGELWTFDLQAFADNYPRISVTTYGRQLSNETRIWPRSRAQVAEAERKLKTEAKPKGK